MTDELMEALREQGFRVRIETYVYGGFHAQAWFRHDPTTYQPRVTVYGDTMAAALLELRIELADRYTGGTG